jgi:hypothetical protein
MHCHHSSSLHQIYTSQISNENIYQGLKPLYDDDNIHSSPYMARQKMGNLFLYVSFTFQHDNDNYILKRIMDYNEFIRTHAT